MVSPRHDARGRTIIQTMVGNLKAAGVLLAEISYITGF
jgi:hypothetical protein